MKKYLLILIFFCTALFVNCNNVEKNYIEKITDNVHYINNLYPKKKESNTSLEFVQKIGDLETENENYQLFKPNDVEIDSDGNILVLDFGNHRIQKYSSDGKYIQTIGRRGQGPGEFEHPRSIEIDEKDNIYISGFNTISIQILDRNGTYLKKAETKRAYPFKVYPNGNIITYDALAVANKGEKGFLLGVYDQSGKLLKSIGKPNQYGQVKLKFNGNIVHIILDKQENLYVAYENQNKIEKYDKNGKLIWVSTRNKSYTESDDLTDFNNEVLSTFSWSLGIDYKDRIWIMAMRKKLTRDEIRHNTNNSVFYFEVYDNNGILLEEVDFEGYSAYYKFTIYNDRLFYINSEREMAIYEYRIIDN